MNKQDKEFIIQRIKTQYTEKSTTELDVLRHLDAKVKRPANVFAYMFGSIGAIIMGCGMSLVMTDIGQTLAINEPMISGIAIGVLGMLITTINYPIFKGILKSRKKKYAAEIISLSDRIMNK